jgi:hypothetical protein
MSLPSLPPTSCGLVESMTLAQSTGFLASCGKPPRFAVLMNGVDYPINAGVPSNSLVLRIDQDDLEVRPTRSSAVDFRDR